MSNAPQQDVSGPVADTQQSTAPFVTAMAILVGVVALALFLGYGKKRPVDPQSIGPEALARRIQPLGRITLEQVVENAAAKTGEQVFQAQCSACHTPGAAGAPKFGDEAAWAPRIKTGFEALLNSALKGKNAMTPQGGGAFSEYEVARAVVYMANKGGAKFAEPKAPAAAASAAK